MDQQELESALPAMTSGEQIMAKIFTAVWLGESKFDFDLIDAVALDDKQRQVIVAWLTTPVFP